MAHPLEGRADNVEVHATYSDKSRTVNVRQLEQAMGAGDVFRWQRGSPSVIWKFGSGHDNLARAMWAAVDLKREFPEVRVEIVYDGPDGPVVKSIHTPPRAGRRRHPKRRR